MKPAWRYTFDLRRIRTQLGQEPDVLTNVGLSGVCRTKNFELVGVKSPGEDAVVGRLAVTSYQPYAVDALADALRIAHDVGNALGVLFSDASVFGVARDSHEVERLEGAKDPDPQSGAGLRLGASLTLRTARGIDQCTPELEAAERVEENTALRADLDTWRLAVLEGDDPTRLIHYYRVYERERGRVLEQEPRLLTSVEIDEIARAFEGALPDRLDHADRERLLSMIRGRLGDVPKRSGPQVLSELLSNTLGREIKPAEVREIDMTRGKFAHNSVTMGEKLTGKPESLLGEAVVALLRNALDVRHEQPEPATSENES